MTALPLPAGLPLDAPSWEQTPLVVRQVIVQLLAVIQQQAAGIAALEARLSETSRTSDRPPSSDPPYDKRTARAGVQGRPGAKPGHPAQATIATHRTALRELLQDIATTAGVPSAPGAALQLHMLIDGATAVAVVDRQPGAAASARAMAATVLAEGRWRR